MSEQAIDTETKELTEEVVHKQIATLSISGVSVNEIARQLNMSRYRVKNVMNSDAYRDHLRDVTESLVSTAANTFKSAMGDMVPEAIRVLKRHLEEGNLEGVKLLIKAIGIERGEQQVQQGNIQVILPSFDTATEVKSEVK